MAISKSITKTRDMQPNSIGSSAVSKGRLEFLEEVLSLAVEGVLLCDENRLIIYANDAFTRITGYDNEEMRGKNCSLLQGEATDPRTLEALRSAVRSGQNFEGEILNYRKDGTPFWNDLSISVIRDDDGRIIRFIGLQRDITDRKHREKELRDLSEALIMEKNRLHESQSVAQVGSWQTDLATLRVTWTDETFRIFESHPHAFEPTHEIFLSFVHPDDRERVHESFTHAAGQQGAFSIEHRLMFPDGRIKHVEERWQTFTDAAGQPAHAVGTCQDITERTLADATMRESEERFARAFEYAPIGMALVAPKGRWLKVNRVLCDMVGYTAEELMQRTFHDITHPDDLGADLENVRRLLHAEIPHYQLEKRYIHADGHPVTVLLSVSLAWGAHGQPLYFICHIKDITGHKEQQNALRRSQDLLRIAGQIARIGGWSFDLLTNTLNWSDEVCLLHDVEPGNVPSVENAIAFYAPESREMVAHYVKRCGDEGTPFEFESVLTTATKRKIWVKSTGEAVRDETGRIIRLQGALQDISDRKQTELAVFQTNRALKMLSGCNEALVRAEKEQDLLDHICQVAVEHGGYRMAWVGYAQHDEGSRIQPQAHAGFEDGYLAQLNLSWSEDKPNSGGTAGHTIRGDGVVLCSDIENDPDFAPWREMALRRGYRSLIKLPLRNEGLNFGLLSLYASEAHVPTADELKLLQELADDLAFGIKSLRSRDATRRMQEAQLISARRTELAARASKVGIWDLDLVTGTLVWDEQMYTLYGADPALKPTGVEFWAAYLDPEDSKLMCGAMQAAQRPNGPPVDTQFRITRHSDGEVRYIRAQAVVIRDDETHPLRMLGTNWDVTDQVLREATLRENLENEKNLRLQALAGERAKSEFLAVMSHEIRTPMNGVLGFAEMLANSPNLSPEDRDLSQIIVSSGGALLRILDDILDFSRIESGRLALEQQMFSPNDLIESIKLLFTRQIHEKGLELKVVIDPALPDAVEGDPGRIRQILVNLVGNALKFTKTGSIEIRTSAALGEADSQNLEFMVRDTGPGISPERADAVFEAFVQEDSSISRRHGGTGLGLAISRRLAELMDGSLSVRSELGEGTAFTLQIPLRLARKPLDPKPSQVIPSAPIDPTFAVTHPLRVLLVEDDNVNLKLLVVILRQLGYEPLTARNGVDAVTTYAKQNPDCILMDLQMPEMDGIEATRAIREIEAAEKRRPVFISALTANTMPESQERCLREGMNAFLTKPLKRQSIVDLLVTASDVLRPAD